MLGQCSYRLFVYTGKSVISYNSIFFHYQYNYIFSIKYKLLYMGLRNPFRPVFRGFPAICYNITIILVIGSCRRSLLLDLMTVKLSFEIAMILLQSITLLQNFATEMFLFILYFFLGFSTMNQNMFGNKIIYLLFILIT